MLNSAFEKTKANQQSYISEIREKREQILSLEVQLQALDNTKGAMADQRAELLEVK